MYQIQKLVLSEEDTDKCYKVIYADVTKYSLIKHNQWSLET